MKQTVQFNYNNNNTAAMKTFDLIQTELECCGTTGPQSWKESVFNDFNFDGELGIASIKSSYNVPLSCCKYDYTIVKHFKQQHPVKMIIISDTS